MFALQPLTRDEMKARWARVQRPRPKPTPPPRPLNLSQVLDLGNTVFFTFRGRAYGIPPLAWRQGEAILDAWLEAREMGDLDHREKTGPYFRIIARLQKLLWKNCRPVGRIRRFLKWIGLHPNPFRKATEGELAELAVFMLGRRMRWSGPAPSPPAAPSPGI